MRTNIVLDEVLIKRGMALTGISTKRALVHEALKLLVQLREQEQVRTLRGQLKWEGDLDELRTSRLSEH